jgi:hypothetical protein
MALFIPRYTQRVQDSPANLTVVQLGMVPDETSEALGPAADRKQLRMTWTISLNSEKPQPWLRSERPLHSSTTLANEPYPVHGNSQLLEVMAFEASRAIAIDGMRACRHGMARYHRQVV